MTTPIKVLAVDDEPLALEYLCRLLKSDPDVELVGSCRNGREALIELGKQIADVVFLDIQMPGLNGMDVVEKLQGDVMPLIIFATAHDEFALQAFDINAVDYLLKPIDADAVARALERARARLLTRSVNVNAKEPLMSALMSIRSRNQGASHGSAGSDEDCAASKTRLAVKDGHQTQLLPFASIDWVDAAGDYMCVHSRGETHIMRITMAQLLERLPDNFVRIHRSTIVNIDRVNAIASLAKGDLLLSLPEDVKLKVSRNYRDLLLTLLDTGLSHSS